MTLDDIQKECPLPDGWSLWEPCHNFGGWQFRATFGTWQALGSVTGIAVYQKFPWGGQMLKVAIATENGDEFDGEASNVSGTLQEAFLECRDRVAQVGELGREV